MKNTYKALYVHGYKGKENGSAAGLVRKELEDRKLPVTLDAPDFPVTEPEKMQEALRKLQEENRYDFVIASSLGAFYAMQAGFPVRILVNTAFPGDLRAIREEDPKKHPKITDGFLEELEREKKVFLEAFPKQEWKDASILIFGTEDTVAHSRPMLEPLADAGKVFSAPMGHKMDAVGAGVIGEILSKLC